MDCLPDTRERRGRAATQMPLPNDQPLTTVKTPNKPNKPSKRPDFRPAHERGVFPVGRDLSAPVLSKLPALTSIATARVISPLSGSNAGCAREEPGRTAVLLAQRAHELASLPDPRTSSSKIRT